MFLETLVGIALWKVGKSILDWLDDDAEKKSIEKELKSLETRITGLKEYFSNRPSTIKKLSSFREEFKEALSGDNVDDFKSLLKKWKDTVNDSEKEMEESYNELLNSDFKKAADIKIDFSDYSNKLESIKINYVKNYIKSNFDLKSDDDDLKLDDEQCSAVSKVNHNTIISARAGSGKTTTLIAHVLFLIKKMKIPSNEILILAFNNAAIKDLKKRFEKYLSNDEMPYISTFHALAWSIVQPTDTMLADKDKSLDLSRTIQSIIAKSKRLKPKIDAFLVECINTEWESLGLPKDEEDEEFISDSELLKYRESLKYETIDGKYVKSYGEKIISNFLFRNGIDYRYELPIRWNKRPYRPDFTIFNNNEDTKIKKIIIEYFGLTGNEEYDKETKEKERFWAGQANTYLIEMFPDDIRAGKEFFHKKLSKELARCGIDLNPKSDEEIIALIREKELDPIKNIHSVLVNFVTQARQHNFSLEDLKIEKTKYNFTDIELHFFEIAFYVYEKYLATLKKEKKEDFNGLLIRAISKINNGDLAFNTKEKSGDFSKITHICVDEFQDFSSLFYDLLKKIIQVGHSPVAYCVGDDWQAINGFAGSDTIFFKNFEKMFSPADRGYISTNYRSTVSIVDLGNKIQEITGEKEAVSSNSLSGNLNMYDMTEYLSLKRSYCDFIREILDGVDKQALFLSRTKKVLYEGKMILLEYLEKKINSSFGTEYRFRTIHESKGLESTDVVLLDVTRGKLPLINPLWIFSRIFGNTLEKVIEEERNLFYVAVTRAKKNLYVLYDTELSRFLDGLNVQDMTSLTAYVELNYSTKQVEEMENSLKKKNYKLRYDHEIKKYIKSLPMTHSKEDLLKGYNELYNKRKELIYNIYVRCKTGVLLNTRQTDRSSYEGQRRYRSKYRNNR